MTTKEMKKNYVELIGTVKSDFKLSHVFNGESFYLATLCVKRFSGYKDYIRIIVSQFLFDTKNSCKDKKIHIKGSLRSYVMAENIDQPKHTLSVFADEIEIVDDDTKDMNKVELNGFIGKRPSFTTPKNKKLTCFIIAVQRTFGRKSDYIPVLAWNRNAYLTSILNVGDEIALKGRLQSRDYPNKYKPSVTCRVNEVSIDYIDILGNSNIKDA